MPFSVSLILSVNANGPVFPLLNLLSHGVNVHWKVQCTLSIGLFTHALEQLLFCLTNESSNTLSLVGGMGSFEIFWDVSEWKFKN